MIGDVYRVLTHKSHRCGPKDMTRKPYIIENVGSRMESGEPIMCIQFCGEGQRIPTSQERKQTCASRSP